MEPKEDTIRQRILEVAGAAFAEHGFERATVRQICADAGVNLAAVNYYFGDKRRLYRAVIRAAHEAAFRQTPLPAWDETTPPETKLAGFIRTILERMLGTEQYPWQARLMMREFLHPSEASREVVEEYIRPHHQTLLEILKPLLPADAPQHRRDQTAFSIIGQCVFYKMNCPVLAMLIPPDEFQRNYRPEQLAEHITQFTLAALGQPAATPTKTSATTQRRRVQP